SPTHTYYLLPTPTAPPTTSTLSLHDALPIWFWEPELPTPDSRTDSSPDGPVLQNRRSFPSPPPEYTQNQYPAPESPYPSSQLPRSEEHTSELQSRFDLVCRLLLEKKKNIKYE